MTLLELFRRLSYGELSNLAAGGEGSGEVSATARPRIISYANEGLTRLHSRFILIEKTLLIETVEGITNYHLKRRFAESSSSDVPFPYIKDLPTEPFEEDVLRILAVFDGYGRQRVLNDVGDPFSLFTPQPDMLQVPHPKNGGSFVVAYQARHPELKVDGELDQEIDLPLFLEPALQLYIAHKFLSHMNGQEQTAKGAEYGNAYEGLCAEVEEKDLASSTWHTTHNKLEQRGFV